MNAPLPAGFALSYTFLNDYDNCPFKAFSKYVAKTTPYVEGPDQKRGNMLHKAMEQRITSGKPLPLEVEFMEPIAKAVMAAGLVEGERKVAVADTWAPVSFSAANVWLKGKIDCTITRGTEVVILDWKTGKEREDPFELEIQTALLRCTRPEITAVTAHYVWTRDTPRMGEAHLPNITRTQIAVNSMAAHVANAMRMGHWPKRENPLCKWCDVLTCEFNRKGKQ